jgi:hypothetical protein
MQILIDDQHLPIKCFISFLLKVVMVKTYTDVQME